LSIVTGDLSKIQQTINNTSRSWMSAPAERRKQGTREEDGQGENAEEPSA